MEYIPAILVVTVVCLLAAPVVIKLVLRGGVFVVCLTIALLLRQYAAWAILLLVPLPPITAEVIAVVLLYLAIWSILRWSIRKIRPAKR